MNEPEARPQEQDDTIRALEPQEKTHTRQPDFHGDIDFDEEEFICIRSTN
ncbi:hypothetical protein [Legionella spiritensis]|nr:hypothetical protein [Legionella spiritensis]SNV48418.1 Uncharacterised protein [Legionella spiritensis]